MRGGARLALALLALAAVGCPDRSGSSDGRILAKDVPADPNARLAELAANKDADKERALKVPATAQVTNGALQLAVTELTLAHTAQGPTLAVTTEDHFLKVTLALRNAGKDPLPVGLPTSYVEDAAHHAYPLAVDAQRIAGSRLPELIAPGGEWKGTLYFNLPAQALVGGLSLVLPPGSKDTNQVKLTLR